MRLSTIPCSLVVAVVCALAGAHAHAQAPEKSPAAAQTAPPTLEQIRQAAQQGNAAAQYSLGVAYATGQGVPASGAQALAWWRKAAVQGFPPAEYAVGRATPLSAPEPALQVT